MTLVCSWLNRYGGCKRSRQEQGFSHLNEHKRKGSVGVFLQRIPFLRLPGAANPSEADLLAGPMRSGSPRHRGFCLAPERPPQGGVCERSASPWSGLVGRAQFVEQLRVSTNGPLPSCEVNYSTVSLPQPVKRIRANSSVPLLFIELRQRSQFASGESTIYAALFHEYTRLILTHYDK